MNNLHSTTFASKGSIAVVLETRADLKRRLVQAKRLRETASDDDTRDRLTEMVRELERLVEIAADREDGDN